MAVSLDELTFDNRFTDDLPGDPMDLNQPRQVHNAAYSRVRPKATASPKLLAHSPEVLADLGLDSRIAETDEFARVFSGNATLAAMEPYAMAYGGHQFGHWAGQLGDGRAIALGEIVTDDGARTCSSSKAPAPRPTAAGPMASPCFAAPCANSCAAKQCITWVPPRLVR